MEGIYKELKRKEWVLHMLTNMRIALTPYPYSYPLILCRDTKDLGEIAGTEDILSQKCSVQLSAVAR